MAIKYLDDTGLTELVTKTKNLVATKQDTLVSGTNIKTINNTSLLGSGDINTHDITEISTEYIRITDLNTGIYKCTYTSGAIKIYYNGSTATDVDNLTSTGYLGENLLYVSKEGTKWTWWCYNTANAVGARLRFGTTTTSSGTRDVLVLSNVPKYAIDNLTEQYSYGYALDAHQGYVLDQNKVDKTNQVSKLYGTSNVGAQDLHTYSYDNANAWTFVQRDANGDVFVPSTPTSNNGATSKTYVDSNFVALNGNGRIADINTIIQANKTFYYDNNTTNQPNSEAWWGTVQYIAGTDDGWFTQLVFPNDVDYFYRRDYANNSWKSWKQIYTNPANVTQLLTSQITANTDVELNGSITDYRYIVIGGCDQSNGGKSHVMLPTKLFTTNVDSAIKDGWNRLVVTTSDGWVSLWYVRERSNGHSLFHIDGFSSSPNFNWLLVYGVK